MSPIEFIILFIIAHYLVNILDGILIGIYTVITGKKIHEINVKWSYKK